MNTTKTRIISYDSMQSVAPVVDDSFNFKTIKSNLATFKQEVVNPKKISKINPNIDYFPVYYKKEIRASFIKLLIWIIILLISTTGFALGLWQIFSEKVLSPWLCVAIIPIFTLILWLSLTNINKFYYLRNEARTINFKDEKVIPLSMKKAYKRLKTSGPNIYWTCGAIYAICLLAYIVNALIVLFVFKNDDISFGFFTEYYNLADLSYFIVAVTCISLALLTLVTHFFMLLFAYFRTARIDSFYNFQIVEQEEINISKKAKNKRDLILFLIVVGIIGLFFYLIYKICKKRFSKGPTSLIVKG